MGAEAIVIGAALAASAAMAAQQQRQTRKAQNSQNEALSAQLAEEARRKREGSILPDTEGVAVEEARRRRLALSRNEDKRRSAVNFTGDGERSPLVISSDTADDPEEK